MVAEGDAGGAASVQPQGSLEGQGGAVRAMALFPFLLHFLKFGCKMSKFWGSDVQNGESESLSHAVVSDSLWPHGL